MSEPNGERTESLLELARRAAEVARTRGAREVAAGAYRARHVEMSYRDGAVEKVTEATTRGVGLDLYVDGRYASVSTSDLREGALELFIEQAVALARALEPDPHRRLPDPTLYEGQTDKELELEDPTIAELTPELRLEAVRLAESASRDLEGAERIVSVTTSVSDTVAESALVQTNGFEGTKRGTDAWMGAEVTVLDPDGRRPEEYAVSGGRFRSFMEPPRTVGRRAAERALARLGSTKGASAEVKLVVDNRSAGRLVGALFGALSAASLQQRRSFLEGRQGTSIGSPLLDVRDDPHVPRGLGSRRYDGEGIAAKPFPVFERGLLANYYVDTYYGRKLGMTPTSARSSNLRFLLGTKPPTELFRDVGEGVLVTGFLGGNSNGTTGDFSFGVRGFAIRAGQLAEPLSEMNVSGNQLELWKRLASVGNDPYPYSSLRTPTLVFDGVQIAGT